MGLPVHGERGTDQTGRGPREANISFASKAARLPFVQQCRSVGAAIPAQIMATGCGIVKAAAIAKGELAFVA